MKKFVISIIIILSISLIVQSAYYNFKNNDNIVNNDNNKILNKQFITNSKNESNILDIEETKKFDDVIVPKGIADLSVKYQGELKIISIEKALYKFIYTDFQRINEQTKGRTINYKLQYYEMNKDEINKMGIYNAEDYHEISRQINSIGSAGKYKDSKIDTYSFKQTEDGYTKFKVILNYEDNKTINLYMYLANKELTIPNIKISAN